MPEPQTLAELLSEKARAAGRGVPALAAEAGVKYEVALRTLQGKTVPREETARALARVLQIDELSWRAALAVSVRRKATPPDHRMAYLQALIQQHEYLYPSGIAQTVKAVPVRVEEVYVSLQAAAGPPQREPGPEPEGMAEPVLEGDGAAPSETEPEVVEEVFDLGRAVSRSQFAVITGAPGTGKTTLLRYLTLLFARAGLARETQVVDVNGQGYGAAALPVLCRVARYAEQRAPVDLYDYLAGGLEPLDPPVSRAVFAEAFNAGRVVLLLDGLDEIITGAGRAQVNAAIEALRVRCARSGNRLVVTSRIQGYHEAPLTGFEVYTIRDMSREQVTRFLERWCTAMEREVGAPNPPASGRREAEAILRAMEGNAGVRDLAVNPLLCTLIALIHRNHFRLPERRAELLRVAVETLTRLWRARQVNAAGDLSRISISEAEEVLILRPLARWIHEHRDTGIIEEEVLIEQLALHLAERRGSTAGPLEGAEVKEFLDRVRLHSGILVERGPRRYGFMHLLLQEYLAGLCLVDSTVEAVGVIRARRHQPRWQEPIRLGIASKSAGDAAYLLRAGILGQELRDGRWDGAPQCDLESVLHRDLVLAARCAGDCAALDPRLCEELAQRVLKVLLRLREDSIPALRERLVPAMAALWLHQRAALELRPALLAALRDQSESARGRGIVAGALAGVVADPAVRDALLAALRDQSEFVRDEAAGALAGVAAEPGVRDALLAALRVHSAFVCVAAAGALAGVAAEPVVREALFAALRHPDVQLRRRAAGALAGVAAEPAVREMLLAVLGDKETSTHLRTTAAGALAGVAAEPVVRAALLTALLDPSTHVRVAAARALAGLASEPAVLEALLAALLDSSNFVRVAAASALAGLAPKPSVREALLAALRDSSTLVRVAAAGALAGVAGEPAVRDALFAHLESAEGYVRGACAGALAGVAADPAIRDALLVALQDRDPYVRDRASGALAGVAADPTVRAALLIALGDKADFVRVVAAGALAGVAEEPAVRKALLEALREDRVWGVRAAAAGALAGVAAESDVRVALRVAVGDAEMGVRDAAWQSLLRGAEGR